MQLLISFKLISGKLEQAVAYLINKVMYIFMKKGAVLRQFLWCIFALILLVFSLGISWQISKTTNFLYSFWYQTLHINDVVIKNVPKNTQGKRDFPIDNIQLHETKFADIVQAIHQQGYGLAEISYVNNHAISKRLLTNAEVLHLKDVANLLNAVEKLWWGSLILLFGVLFLYGLNIDKINVNSIRKMPTGKQKIMSLLSFIVLLVVVLGIWGFTEVFYYLHTVIFPAEHQWFFYYRDSLMATLMKAPDIFSAIAAQLLAVALLIAWAVDTALSSYQVKRLRNSNK